METISGCIKSLDNIINDIEQSLCRPNSCSADGPGVTDEKGSTIIKPSGHSSSSSHGDEPMTSAKADRNPSKAELKKKEKSAAKKQQSSNILSDADSLYHQCDLRTGRILHVEGHPEADGLFVMKVTVGNDETRTVCAGLKKFIPAEELKGRLVVLICNLKPRKLRGIDSEAMCLAGSVASDGEKEKVVPLSVQAETAVGSRISAEGIEGESAVAEGKYLSGKNWDKVVARLRVLDGKACYDGRVLTALNSPIYCDLPDGSEIH